MRSAENSREMQHECCRPNSKLLNQHSGNRELEYSTLPRSVTDYLFGDDLTNHLEEIGDQNKIGNHLGNKGGRFQNVYNAYTGPYSKPRQWLKTGGWTGKKFS